MRAMVKIEKLVKKILKNTRKQIKKLARALGFSKKQSVQIATKNTHNLIETMENYRKISNSDQNLNFEPGFLSNISWSFLNNDSTKDEYGYEIPIKLNNTPIYESVAEPIYESVAEPIYENIPSSKNEPIYDYLPPAKPVSELKKETIVPVSQLDSAKVSNVYKKITENENSIVEENTVER
ncbi:hypothetical protein [Spiroplasma melliferum]|uniref:Uncharacterized protein n=2 Tax=Spiroplasma melliferum TaxID=2134 RepID=A0AAI9X0L5_SPIME|nr:hypothetical protein [Spiroplasma melliferum]KAI92257.1 hypothetical protein SPM_005905 [Spiroplasma melliferum KC3]QCO23681.1 hypothetical protein SRED_002152 [Spiroplasma melliferum]